ncbi:hypothetical protein [Pseudomonas nitroreducens]|uniref:hypothetical protein n=1 Tax=Pseudomonas nitroreducens TaxID=46680 RepID=UPI002D7E2F45|nr:hypothetical protein [Pseudomonas nitroreducens]
MSLAEERSAIARGIAESRRATQLVSDINSLQDQRRAIRTLNELERRGARPATPGRADWKASRSGGAGVASPLQEQNYADRVFFNPQLIESSDGLFTLRVEPLEKLVMRDANNAEAVFLFKEPPAPDL